MKRSDAERELRQAGVTIKQGAKHSKLYLGEKRSVLPRHAEIPDQLFKAIKKQLGLK